MYGYRPRHFRRRRLMREVRERRRLMVLSRPDKRTPIIPHTTAVFRRLWRMQNEREG